jgi:hypothetical protein
MMEAIFLLVGFVIGFGLAWLIFDSICRGH